MKEYLCKCNNCGSIMFDENPQVDAVKQEVTGVEIGMEYLHGDDGERYWGCPICETDDYLSDDLN